MHLWLHDQVLERRCIKQQEAMYRDDDLPPDKDDHLPAGKKRRIQEEERGL